MARLVTRLEEVIGADYASREDPLLGHPTMNIGVIEGGMQVNFVPDSCRIEVDVRTIPGQTAEEVTAQFAETIAEVEGIDAVLEEPYITLGALGTGEDAEVVQSAVAACREVLGEAEIGGVPYATDGSPFADLGVPTIILGPGSIDQAHGAVEWIECRQVVQAVDVYQRIMMSPG
jgi:acetylornithine deacetylase